MIAEIVYIRPVNVNVNVKHYNSGYFIFMKKMFTVHNIITDNITIYGFAIVDTGWAHIQVDPCISWEFVV